MYGVRTYLVKLSCAIIYQMAFLALIIAGIDCECGTVCRTKATALSRMLIGRSAVFIVAFIVNHVLLWWATKTYAGEMEDVVMYTLCNTTRLPTRVNGRLRLEVSKKAKLLVVN